ncbi:1-acyl-sn-glycerol-3-phosphate acyltransferase [Brachybacterium sp. Z12]|uniref:lysophospholipid acyltransferase family protein n=1 Tax=Brachybacterium sp. Z12 TaxID=2759167 RepID=UPI001862B376|nr:lysophospholipid acyltransferase family protein [Brachybacterium sp. Z12]QNN82093.1 1-acyl-sn-glycerol-3-phosphate acyltransferase [Brachybacterium sp. Z12]
MAKRFYFGARNISRPFFKLLWNPRITGLENIPREGGFVIASNHLANIDSFVLPVALPRQIRFVAKDTLWTQKGIRGRILHWFFEAVEAVPVDREALSSGKGALQAGLSILREGDGFAIYPEGTRSKDGLLHPGKQGAAWLAVESGCPVIPVGLKGTQHMFSRLLPHRGAITVRVGTPIELDDIDPTASKGVRRRLLNARIMEEIQALSGQRRAVPSRPIA